MRAPKRTELEKKLPTHRQAELLDTIGCYESEHGRPPSLYDLAAMEGVGTNAVRCVLQNLRQLGFLTWEHDGKRTLRRDGGIVVVGSVG